jgi:hypothetical protein
VFEVAAVIFECADDKEVDEEALALVVVVW